MKATLFTLIALTISLYSFGQSPEAFKYQAVVRNSSGTIITNQAVGYQLSILQGSPSGTSVYTETFNPTTNAYGLVNLEIGTGVTTDDFSLIDWANGPYYIETSIDINGGTNYIVMGASQLVSVPYALHAKTAGSITGGISETDPIFGASVASGITGSDTTYWNNKLDTEVDGDTTNEIQALSISNDTVYLSDGGFVKLPAGFDGQYSSLTGTPTNVSTFTNDAGYLTSFNEVDGDTTNELQTLSLSNDTLTLSNGGGSIITSHFKTKQTILFNIDGYTNTAGLNQYFTNNRLSFSSDETNFGDIFSPTNISNPHILKYGFVVPAKGKVKFLSGWFELQQVNMIENVEFHLFKVTPINNSSYLLSYSSTEIGTGITINISQTNIEIVKMVENYMINNIVNEGDVLIFTVKRTSDNCSCNFIMNWKGNILLELD